MAKGVYSFVLAAATAVMALTGVATMADSSGDVAGLVIGAVATTVCGYMSVRAVLACAFVRRGQVVYIGYWRSRRIPCSQVVEVRIEPVDPTTWLPHIAPVLVLADGVEIDLPALATLGWRGRSAHMERFVGQIS